MSSTMSDRQAERVIGLLEWIAGLLVGILVLCGGILGLLWARA